jgi:hypothetical protein
MWGGVMKIQLQAFLTSALDWVEESSSYVDRFILLIQHHIRFAWSSEERYLLVLPRIEPRINCWQACALVSIPTEPSKLLRLLCWPRFLTFFPCFQNKIKFEDVSPLCHSLSFRLLNHWSRGGGGRSRSWEVSARNPLTSGRIWPSIRR